MGGVPVSQEVLNLFEDKWLELKNKHPDREPISKEVLESVRRHLLYQKRGNVPLPKLRKSQQIVSGIRLRYLSIDNKEKSLDEDWKMAAMKNLKEYDIPAYALPEVVKVWHYAASANEKFTIRQAKWVSRLYSMPKLDNITRLWFWSHRYAYLEQLSLITKEPFDTYVPDIALFMTKWERSVLDSTDFRHERVRFISERLLPPKKDGEYVLELLHGIQRHNPWSEEDIYNQRDENLYNLVRKLPSLKSLGFHEETKFVYLRIFTTHVINGPKWKDLSPEDALDVIVKLREIILKEQEFRQKSDDFENDFLRAFNLNSLPFRSGMRELLSKVGYEIKYEIESKSSPEEEKAKKEFLSKSRFRIVRHKEDE